MVRLVQLQNANSLPTLDLAAPDFYLFLAFAPIRFDSNAGYIKCSSVSGGMGCWDRRHFNWTFLHEEIAKQQISTIFTICSKLDSRKNQSDSLGHIYKQLLS